MAQAWVISVDMGYGHQRAAHALKDMAYERIITANNDRIISEEERHLWERARGFYEFVSRLKQFPLLGKAFFGLYDQLQKIGPLYPFRDLSSPNYTALHLRRLIKKGLCRGLVQYTRKKKLPIVTTHFIPALAYNYAGIDCYCVVTDSDINRVWVPCNPRKSKITYFSPTSHTTLRLREYGVPEERIIETGFPLPKENVGTHREILKKDLLARLANLDPQLTFFPKYGHLVKEHLLPRKKHLSMHQFEQHRDHPLTLAFLVGGSGAQVDIGLDIVRSLKQEILSGKMRVILSAGSRLDVKEDFERHLKGYGLGKHLGKGILIIFALDKRSYFDALNNALRTTDIIWTKPSELSFYTGLGMPIIIAPPIGAHEHFNKEWLEHIGSGFVQKNPLYTKDWLFYWLSTGRFADAALQGYLDARALGTYNIEAYLRKHRT
jgi:hypothetical protein